MESISHGQGSQVADLTAYIRERLVSRKILLMTHVIAGYPSWEANWQMLEIMQEVGVDMVELQMPFSEPVADGPTFARANQLALRQGIRLDQYFDFMRRATGTFDFPHLMMGYYNVAFRLGHTEFCARLRENGATGFILPDLPFEEYGDLFESSAKRHLSPILLMAPTNTPARMAAIGKHSQGFVYAVARKGVTGRKTDLDHGLNTFVEDCRRATELPLALGFGLRGGDDLRRLQGAVEMAIVGSALLETWEEGGVEEYRQFLTELAEGRN